MKDTYTYSLCKICHNGKFSHTCKVVELTEDWIQTLADLTATRLPNELHNRLRKVLE